jgi:hypothetical protein
MTHKLKFFICFFASVLCVSGEFLLPQRFFLLRKLLQAIKTSGIW